MPKYRMTVLLCALTWLLAVAFSALSTERHQSQVTENEQSLWDLEHEYWRHVQDNDLPAYRGLWHQDFLGWPSVSPAPVRKDHITDWITSQTSKGLHFNAGEFKPAAVQMTGDIAVVYYWMTFQWLDKDGRGSPHTIRVTHTWLRNGNDWRIIGGMSMQEASPQR